MKMPSNKSLAQIGLGVTMALALVMAWMLYSATYSAFDSSARLLRTHETLRAIDSTDFNFARAESVHRLLLLTGNESFLAERDRYFANAQEFAGRLIELTADNPTQQQRATAIPLLIDERRIIMDLFVQLRRTEGVAAAGARMAEAGQAVGNQMHALTEAIEKDENALLEQRHAESESRHQRTLVILVAAALLGAVVLIPAYFGFLVQARARARADQRLTDMTENLPGAVYRLHSNNGRHFQFEYLSAGVSRLWGIDRQTAMQDFAATWERIVEADRPRVAAVMRQAEQQLIPVQFDFRVHAPNQTVKWLRTSASLHRRADGTVIWNGYWSDVTEQKQLDERLVAAEKLLLEITDGVPGVVFQFRWNRGEPLEFTFLSRGIELLLGIDRAGLIGNSTVLAERILPEYLPGIMASFKFAAKQRLPWCHEFRATHADGRIRWLSTDAIAYQEADGSIVWNGHSKDITDRKDLEQALLDAREAAETANRAKSTFLATMSHEIRTPMNGVLGMLELLTLTKLNAEQRTTVEIINGSSKSLLRLIDDILDFSKIEAGKLTVNPEVASVNEIVQHVFRLYSGNASGKGLLLTPVVDAQISPALWVDAARLQQILNNMVSNAIKFTAKGEVTLSAELFAREVGRDLVRFSVRDTGIGISAEAQQRVFEPFMQADGTTHGQFGGTGLGLSICRRLTEMMGGEIAMKSASGVGTTVSFTLSLPIADPADLANLKATAVKSLATLHSTLMARRRAPSIVDASREGTLVLHVDDHPINCMVLAQQINAIGYAVESAANGAMALEKWQSGRFGLVLTDCNMPVMNGYELAREIRHAESARGLTRIPIIACTANAMGGEAELCLVAGMDGNLVKPVQMSALMKVLDQWLPLSGENATALDRSVLAAISNGKESVERELISLYRRLNDEDAALLHTAVAGADMAAVVRASHRIRGASAMIGARGLAAVCECIEAAGHAGDVNAVAAVMPAFRHEVDSVYIILDSLRLDPLTNLKAS